MEFLSKQGGLVLSVLSIAAFFMNGYSSFVQQASLVDKLYLHSDDKDNKVHDNSNTCAAVDATDPILTGGDLHAKIKTTLQSQQKFTSNYFSYLI